MKRPLRPRAVPLAIGCAVAAVVLVEVLLRITLGLGSPVLFARDARYGYFPRGDQHLHRFFVGIDLNRFGMRSPEPPPAKAPGDWRILFVGDSVAFGTTMVDQADIFPEKIRRQTAARRAGIDVMNAASPGWAPRNEFEYLRARGVYGADVVALVYNTLDLAQPFAAYPGPTLFPTEKPRTALGELWSRYLIPRLRRGQALVDPGSTQNGKPDPDVEADVLRTIEATRRFVIANGARFIIVFTPAATPDVARDPTEWNQPLGKLRRWAVENQVPFLDMTPVLGSRDAASVYFDGIHLRPAGDELVAEEFVRWLCTQRPCT